ANRQTTRVEDAAYSLLGIFKVHMPLIYGEGHRAFYLQKEIMKSTEDYTMLAWGLSKYLSNKHHWKGIQRNNLGDPRHPLPTAPPTLNCTTGQSGPICDCWQTRATPHPFRLLRRLTTPRRESPAAAFVCCSC
ncbi:hypothetical protein C8A05DRAFT_15969, partial [Staphylotrichum tortipilum]